MSMTLFVLCPNGRRQPVKVSPNSSVLEVLEEACKKQGFNPGDYDVRHYNRRVDLSLSVRFANLPNNALLELSPAEKIRSESEITVALQLESGERVVSNFLPSSSMYDIVQNCITSRGEVMLEEMQSGEPVCIYMRQQFAGEQLKTTTLRSLGLTGGKTIIRLMYRPLDTLSEQAHVSAPLTKPQSPVEEAPSPATRRTMAPESRETVSSKQRRLDSEVQSFSFGGNETSRASGSQNQNSHSTFPSAQSTHSKPTEGSSVFAAGGHATNSVAAAPSEEMKTENDEEAMECENSETVEEIGEIKFLGPRNAVLFNLEDIAEVKKEDFPPEFFDLTVNDVQYLFADYKRVREQLENEPLTLKSHKEAQILQKFACYKQTVIRVYFPDKLVLQGTFITEETVQSVKDFVSNFLANQQLDFYLYITPPKTKLSPEKTLLEARLVPAAVMYFGCDTPSGSYLRDEIRNQISDPRAAWKIAAQHRQKGSSNEISAQYIPVPTDTEMGNGYEDISVVPQTFEERVNTVPAEKQGVKPKWFKLGTK